MENRFTVTRPILTKRDMAKKLFQDFCARVYTNGQLNDGKYDAVTYWKAAQLRTASVDAIFETIKANPLAKEYFFMDAIQRGYFDAIIEDAYEKAIKREEAQINQDYPEFF